MPLYWQSNEETALLRILLIAAIPDHQMVTGGERGAEIYRSVL